LRIINTSNKPYEFTYDGGHYGPYKPGEIVELDEVMGHFALKKSAVLIQDPEDPGVGEIDHYQMEPVENVAKDKIRGMVTYTCPLVQSGQCDAKPFKSLGELKAHQDLHWELAEEPVGAKASMAPMQKTMTK
jgi:hypothetical protein